LRGPQLIIRRGVETAVMLAVAHHRKIRMGAKSITDLFRSSQLVGEDLDLSRHRSRIRAVPGL
jgi:hypothetical protein